MLDIKNYLIKIMVKVGLRKSPENAGIRINNSHNITISKGKVSGYDRGIDADKVTSLHVIDTEIKNG